MIKNYLKTAWRNILLNKSFSLINICGLALGTSLCMVLITLIKDQVSFDKFHVNKERIYRVNTEATRKNGDVENYASTPFPLGTVLKNNYSYIKKVTRLSGGLSGDVEYADKVLSLRGFFTDPEFFEVFSFDLLYGNKNTALREPNGIILTEKTSRKFFGNTNPVGKIIRIKGLDAFKVTGIIKTAPGKTHLEFDMLSSNVTLLGYEKEGKVPGMVYDWLNYYNSYIYVLFNNAEDAKKLEGSLDQITKDHYAKLETESRDKKYAFYLQALEKIVPGPMLSNNMGKGLPSMVLWALGIFAFIIIVSAGFNYSSLTLGRSLSRAKEIGIRKTNGAQRYQLVFLFLIESLVITLIAFLVASLLFHFFLRNIFEGFSIFRELDIVLTENVFLYFIFAVFCLLVGVVSGIFPAIYLSSLNPVLAFKNVRNKTQSSKMGFRRVLLITQFSIALLFIITLINIYRQLNYVTHADYGFKKDNIVNVELQGNDYHKALALFSQNNHVLKISGISHSLGTFHDRSADIRVNTSDEKSQVRDYSIDQNYLDNLELKLLAGRNFQDKSYGEREFFVVVNETFIKRFRLGTPEQAVGKPVIIGDSTVVTICGVLKDFHFRPYTYHIEPLVFRNIPRDITQLNIRLSGHNNNLAVEQLQQTWKSFDNIHSFSYLFFKDALEDTYQSFNDIKWLLVIVALMAVVVACLGFLGAVIFLAGQKYKEISVRKILGASSTQITILLSRNYIKLFTISFLIGLPLSMLVNNVLMNVFAYKVNPLAGYIIGILLLLGLATATVVAEILRSAISNPIKSLRTE